MANSVNSIWTIERIGKLIDLQGRHWSCSQIAAELGCGISRNAVIGKLHRLGISGGDRAMSKLERDRRSKAAKERNQQRQNERRRERRREFREQAPPSPAGPARAFVPLMICTEVEPLGVPLLDLKEGDCRYPDGEGTEITFCGHPRAMGRSYCLPHARLTLNSDRSWSRGEIEAYRRDRKAKFNQTLLEAAE